MSDSILLTIKPLVNVEPDDHEFDTDILVGINTALSELDQLGVGPVGGLFVTDDTASWSDLFTSPKLNMVKSYVHLRTKLLFDPPASSSILKAYESQLEMLAWRISVAVETCDIFPPVPPPIQKYIRAEGRGSGIYIQTNYAVSVDGSRIYIS